MARMSALFAVLALATAAPGATAAPSFNNFTAQYVCENMIGTRQNTDGKHYLAGDWNLTTCDSACKDAMVQATHTGLGCCSYNNATNGCCWSEVSTPVPPYTPSDQKFASIIDAGKWHAKKASDHYEKKEYAAAAIAYEAAIASFVSTFGEDHLLTKGVKERHSIVKVLNNKPARTDLDANYPYTSNTTQLDLCSDGKRNGDETGVDCGGSCTVCPVDCVYSETTCSCTPACDKTCDCTDGITITTPAAGRGQACPSVTNRTFTGAACPTDCHKGLLNGHANFCTPTCKCQHGEGDCDGDSTCVDGTECVNNIGATYGWSSGTDVCQTVPTPAPSAYSDMHIGRDCNGIAGTFFPLMYDTLLAQCKAACDNLDTCTSIEFQDKMKDGVTRGKCYKVKDCPSWNWNYVGSWVSMDATGK